jgi:hypothetical protein
VDQPGRQQRRTRYGAHVSHPQMDHNGQQARISIWRTAMLIISLLILMYDRGDPKHPTHRLQSYLDAEPVRVVHTSGLLTPTRQWLQPKIDTRGTVATEATVAQDVPTAINATSNNRTQRWNPTAAHSANGDMAPSGSSARVTCQQQMVYPKIKKDTIRTKHNPTSAKPDSRGHTFRGNTD